MICIRTNLGVDFARRIAEFDNDNRPVFIHIILMVPDQPGFYDYQFKKN